MLATVDNSLRSSYRALQVIESAIRAHPTRGLFGQKNAVPLDELRVRIVKLAPEEFEDALSDMRDLGLIEESLVRGRTVIKLKSR